MTQRPKKGKQTTADRTVCFCYNVTEKVIIEAILQGECRTVMDIRRDTYASSGCAGCTEEVKKIIRKTVDQDTGELIASENPEAAVEEKDPQEKDES